MARVLLLEANAPQVLWAEAVSHANWLRNRLPTTSDKNQTPFEAWFGEKPNLGSVLKFGQVGYAFEYKPAAIRQKKLLPRSRHGIFVGMESAERLLRIYITSKEVVTPCRSRDFNILKEQLPSFHNLLDSISRHRHETEI